MTKIRAFGKTVEINELPTMIRYPSKEELSKAENKMINKYRELFTRLARRDKYGKL